MRINYVTPVGDEFASFRYRIRIPSQQHLWKSTFGPELDVINEPDITVFSKHWDGDIERIRECTTKTIFDICDDHFDREKGGHYRAMINHAENITCNSEAMRKRIFDVSGREAVVIEDPYESISRVPKFEPYGIPRLCWFGSPTNIGTLEGLRIPGFLELVSAFDKPVMKHGLIYTPWSLKARDRAIERADIVIIPGTKECGSANRLIEAMRQGRFVVASSSPAYDEFKDYAYIGDIAEGVEWALNNKAEVLKKIFKGQAFIAYKFSPRGIAEKWMDLFESI